MSTTPVPVAYTGGTRTYAVTVDADPVDPGFTPKALDHVFGTKKGKQVRLSVVPGPFVPTPAPPVIAPPPPVTPPAGWKLLGTEGFTIPAPVGSFASNDAGKVVYTGDGGLKWTTYPDGWPSTNTNGKPGYQPGQVLSVHDNVLDYYFRTINGLPSGANLCPVLPFSTPSQYQTFGMYVIQFQVTYDDANRLADAHAAFLLWPELDKDYQSAESDFPEADLNAGSVNSYAHYGGSGAQDSSTTAIDWTKVNTFTQVWKPGLRQYLLNGVQVGESTNQVWADPQRWQLQLEPSGRSTGSAGHVLVHSAAVYAPA